MENEELEKVLDEMKEKGSGTLSKEFFDILKESIVCIPSVMPEDTDPEILEKIYQNPGEIQEIPEGARPQPCVLENANHEKFLPVFTSMEELGKGKPIPDFQLFINMKFSSCLEFLNRRPDIAGAVINAYTHNVVFQLNGEKKAQQEKQQAQPQTIQVTLGEFHYLMRNRMEANYLPKKVFEGKGEVVSRLSKEQGTYMKELYEEVYTTEVACPYTAEDFEFMALNISEDLLLVQITMPQKYLMPNTCSSVFVAWNQKEQKIWYYAIVIEEQEKGIHLHRLYEDGRKADLGEAPSEGSELSTILDLMKDGEEG